MLTCLPEDLNKDWIADGVLGCCGTQSSMITVYLFSGSSGSSTTAEGEDMVKEE